MMTAHKFRHWQVKALEEELRDSTIQIQEAKTQIAVLHSQRQTQSAQISREPVAERESLAQFKKEV
ncbi:hypothetical protein M758_3G032900 [Ceratodon purpureus]|nr:hypothetical protein M758_3G032900 [Ceratodon purpureus]